VADRFHLISFALVAGCAPALAGTNMPVRPGAEVPQGAATRLTIAPDTNAKVVLNVIPNAICQIMPANGVGEPRRFQTIDSDAAGNAEFYARPSGASERDLELTVECVSGKTTMRYPVTLRANSGPTPDMPAPAAERPKLTEGVTLAPLTAEYADRLSDEEIIKRGYPPRPDKDGAPQAFRAWLNAVSQPMKMISPHLIPSPDVRHDKSSNNWSGMELRSFNGSFGWVAGTWTVPAVIPPPTPFQTGYSSTWVGLDGDGFADLVQAGTEQDATLFQINTPGSVQWIVTSYYAWSEFLPQQSTSQTVSNFAIHPGDQIFTEVYVANAGGGPSLNGAFGQFVISNLTTQESTQITTARGNTNVGGSDAVWIMERLTINGGLPALANYGSASIVNGSARRPNAPPHQGYSNCCGAGALTIDMFNGANKISHAASGGDTSVNFTWKAFQ
jgi:hypothetical protein